MRALLCAALYAGLSAPAAAQEPPRSDAARDAARDTAEDGAMRAAEMAKAAELKAQRLAAERDRLSQKLAELGGSIVERETELLETRERLDALHQSVGQARKRLNITMLELERMLKSLPRAAREPTPSLLIHPDRPVAAARSALLLRSLSAKLRAAAAKARQDLQTISAARHEASLLEARAAQDLQTLRAAESEVRVLLGERDVAADTAFAAAKRAAQDAKRLREAADSLGDLAGAFHRAPQSAPPSQIRPQQQPFSTARGELLRPVAGRLARKTNEMLSRKGVQFITSPFARVIAPWSGTVLYADEFRDFGKVVILEPQKEYLLVLTGLESIDRSVGEWVRAGEPLGRMGGPAPTTSEFMFELNERTRASREKLYLDVRHKGDTLDTEPWLSSATRKGNQL